MAARIMRRDAPSEQYQHLQLARFLILLRKTAERQRPVRILGCNLDDGAAGFAHAALLGRWRGDLSKPVVVRREVPCGLIFRPCRILAPMGQGNKALGCFHEGYAPPPAPRESKQKLGPQLTPHILCWNIRLDFVVSKAR